MTQDRGFWAHFLFAIIRLTPLAAPVAIIPAIPDEPILAELLFKQWLSLLMVLVTWNMTEGAAILWMNAKRNSSEKTRSYLLVVMILGAISIGFLQYLRTLTSQGIFILVLAILSLRGMSRTGWENQRPLAGFAGAIVAHSLTTLVSFLFITPALDWQSVVCAVAVGTSIAAMEASWYASSFNGTSSRWGLPLFRISLCLGPVIIATMGMSNQLPQYYIAAALVVPLSSRIIKKTRLDNAIPSSLVWGAAGIYLAFLAIMALCRAYESRVFQ